MNSTEPNRPGQEPSVSEIAALNRRLRELSAQGRDADPAERAAFLADKDALLARIADTHTDFGGEFLPADGVGQEPHGHHARLGRRDEVADDAAVAMPEWMREQARRTEAEIAAGNAPPPRPDDLDELAARIATLQERIAARDTDASFTGRTVDPEQDARGDQLARWHRDDTTENDASEDDAATADHDQAGRVADSATEQGWSR